jgi:hypothetical protein
MSQFNPVHTLTFYLFMRTLRYYPLTPDDLLSSDFLTKVVEKFIINIRATCPSHLIITYLIHTNYET